jgi:hypothetical protein
VILSVVGGIALLSFCAFGWMRGWCSASSTKLNNSSDDAPTDGPGPLNGPRSAGHHSLNQHNVHFNRITQTARDQSKQSPNHIVQNPSHGDDSSDNEAESDAERMLLEEEGFNLPGFQPGGISSPSAPIPNPVSGSATGPPVAQAVAQATPTATPTAASVSTTTPTVMQATSRSVSFVDEASYASTVVYSEPTTGESHTNRSGKEDHSFVVVFGHREFSNLIMLSFSFWLKIILSFKDFKKNVDFPIFPYTVQHLCDFSSVNFTNTEFR